ncbi:MAG: hypothetical protein K0S11_73 [Gammaproteobacteria bacterium]|jgi:hypothetical protein|nr:hypothetical protein [Gammaproteobacteria bacterium]
MNQSHPTIIAQQDVPLAKSIIWEWQRLFFIEQGIHAWIKQVPFYITNNPYIANSYANIIIRFIQDYSRRNPANQLEPFYIIELGAGCGLFCFYTIKRLLQLQKQLKLEHVKFVYVLTDFVDYNINFLQQHVQLQAYFEQGILDIAKFDIEQDDQLVLLNSNLTLNRTDNQNNSHNPMIVIANYIFDSICHDIFSIKEGQLQEALVTLNVNKQYYESALKNYQGQPIEHIDTIFNYRDTDTNYYADPSFNTVLEYYLAHYQNINLSFPIGALGCLKRLQKLTQNHLLLLVTDKGIASSPNENIGQDTNIAFHGSISMMVNLHALGLYTQLLDGDFYYQERQQSISSCAFLLGERLQDLPETQQALKTYFNYYSPGNLFELYHNSYIYNSHLNLAELLTFLNLSCYDPMIFNRWLEKILYAAQNAIELLVSDLVKLLPKFAENFYYLPEQPNIFFNIGVFLQEFKHYQEAIDYYELSLNYILQKELAYYNIGICNYYLADYQSAIAMMERYIKVFVNDVAAYSWLMKAKAKLANIALPIFLSDRD